MRHNLKKLGSTERHTFTAEFGRFGTKSGWYSPEKTVLLKNIKLKSGDGKILADHLWFTCGKGFDELNLSEGDVVQFDARVDSYVKGYFGWDEMKSLEHPSEEDFKLSRPTKLFKLDENGVPVKLIKHTLPEEKTVRQASEKMLDFAKIISDAGIPGIEKLELADDGFPTDRSFDFIHSYINSNADAFKAGREKRK